VAGVDQQQLQPAFLQHIPAGLPVLARRLHHHLGDALGLQPVGQRLQARGERRVGADLLAASSPTPTRAGRIRDAMQATTSSLPTSRAAARSTISSTACHLLADRLCWRRPAGPTEETMLKRVLAANSSWCRVGPRINLRHGLARTNESRAWPGVAILIRRGGQRPWHLRRLRVERRALRGPSSVMERRPSGLVASLDVGCCCRVAELQRVKLKVACVEVMVARDHAGACGGTIWRWALGAASARAAQQMSARGSVDWVAAAPAEGTEPYPSFRA
jgi:hypothetical protein